MKFYRIIPNSKIPTFFGFSAQTFGPFILIPGNTVHYRVLTHEKHHVAQFYMGWLVGLLLWMVVDVSWWWLLATPLTFSVAYTLAGLVALARGGRWYRDNWFEKDARRHAGEV